MAFGYAEPFSAQIAAKWEQSGHTIFLNHSTTGDGMIAVFAWKAGAHISEDLDLVVMNADGSGAQVVVPGAATRSLCGFDLDWSPDGNRIAWASGGQVWTVRADGTERTNIATGCVSHVEWSPDGTTLALGTSEDQVPVVVHDHHTDQRHRSHHIGPRETFRRRRHPGLGSGAVQIHSYSSTFVVISGNFLDLSVVAPAHNEAGNVGRLVEEVAAALRDLVSTPHSGR